jgi:ATP-dependent metalloprotease
MLASQLVSTIRQDFTLLREAREQRRLRNQLTIQPFNNNVRFLTSSYSSPALPLNCKLTSSTLLNNTLNQVNIPKRTFFGNLRQDLHLKSLERSANAHPHDVHAQYEFLSNLSQSYPEAVIDRFEQYKEFAVDERIALLYLNALSRTGNVNKFGLKRFVDRLQQSGGVGMETIAALQELSHSKLGKGELATRASRVLNGGGGEGGVATGMGGGVLNMSRGNSPNSPLFIQTHSPVKSTDMLFTLVRHVLLAFVVVSALTVVFTEQGMGRGGMAAMGNGKHIQEAEGSDVRFDDVKGVTEAKAELEEIVLYLKDPERFTRLGGKLPRGLLLTGPPGTGKTLLAKAIAGEAGVPFFFASGSQFEEVYVGLGAKRIRELFEAAKQKSPSIIFIDEIDAVGGTRKLKDQSALKQTLNELLVQMDGFEENNGIIVIGATNFAEALDSALLRPGRFDKHVAVPLPDVGGRKEILDMYAAKTKISEEVDLSVLARGTTGFSGADLYNLMNQAALKASVDGLDKITMEIFEWAKDKISKLCAIHSLC